MLRKLLFVGVIICASINIANGAPGNKTPSVSAIISSPLETRHLSPGDNVILHAKIIFENEEKVRAGLGKLLVFVNCNPELVVYDFWLRINNQIIPAAVESQDSARFYLGEVRRDPSAIVDLEIEAHVSNITSDAYLQAEIYTNDFTFFVGDTYYTASLPYEKVIGNALAY